MNSINIIGTLGRDPQINAAGTVASISIAVKRKFKNKQTNEYETDWFNCKAFNKTAELIRDNFSKGSQIAFEGHLQNNNHEKDGKIVYRDEIIVDGITFIGSKNSVQSNEDYQQPNTQQYNSNQSSNQNSNQYSNHDPFDKSSTPVDIDDDDLPF